MTTTRTKNVETQGQLLSHLRADGRALRDEFESARDQAATKRLAQLEAENRALRKQLLTSQRLAALGTMSAMVAHEFNNILTPVISYAQLAESDPSLQAKAIARAADGGRRATDICRAILGIARDESAEATEVDIAELITKTLLAMGRNPKRDGIELTIDAPSGMTLVTHKVELQQVLLNLLLNARTAVTQRSMPRRIRIAAERSDDKAVLRVADNGVGIPREDLENVFRPFFSTGRQTDGKTGGTGLGLAVCRQIMDSLDGQISVESAPGEGTTFTLRLPA